MLQLVRAKVASMASLVTLPLLPLSVRLRPPGRAASDSTNARCLITALLPPCPVQGDEPLIEPECIDAVVQALQDSPDAVYRWAWVLLQVCCHPDKAQPAT